MGSSLATRGFRGSRTFVQSEFERVRCGQGRAPVRPSGAGATLWGPSMPLTLITGPANAAKAGAVLERLRAALARDPVLVVPTAADADHYERELAAAGVVTGAEVLTFARLVRRIAEVTDVDGRVLGRVARERVVAAAVGDVELRAL